MRGYTIRRGKVYGGPRTKLGNDTVSFVRVGRTVVFGGPVDKLPKTVKADVLCRVGL
jgi:hypothetical protein